MSRLVSRRAIGLPAALIVGVLIAFPLGVIASHRFTDVPDSNTYHADIDALADAGVTTGCGDGTTFCPSAFVTREQMAAFMNRLGALAAGKTPVVNADKVDGLDSTDFLAATEIVTQHYGPWERTTSTQGAAQAFAGDSYVSLYNPSGAVDWTWALPLPAPAAIGEVSYGLSSIRLCYGFSDDANITGVFLRETGTAGGLLASDATVHLADSPGCFSVTDFTPAPLTGAAHLRLRVDYTAQGYLQVRSVRATWVPVSG